MMGYSRYYFHTFLVTAEERSSDTTYIIVFTKESKKNAFDNKCQMELIVDLGIFFSKSFKSV